MTISKYDSNTFILSQFGTMLKDYRIAASMTQNELALKSGVSQRTISSIENGKDSSIENIIRILKVLDLVENLNNLIPNTREKVKVEETEERKRFRKSSSDSSWKWGDEQ